LPETGSATKRFGRRFPDRRIVDRHFHQSSKLIPLNVISLSHPIPNIGICKGQRKFPLFAAIASSVRHDAG
jgi:hypothetical protein